MSRREEAAAAGEDGRGSSVHDDTATTPATGAEGKPDVVVAGLVCLDLVCRMAGTDVALAPGGLLEVAGTRISTGGVVANSGLTLQRLGLRTRLMGLVGDDPFAQVLRRALQAGGATDLSGIATAAGAATSYTLVLTPPGGERMFVHDPGPYADFDADAVDLELVAGARLVHFGYPPLMPRLCRDGGEPLARLLGGLRERGVTVSLDLAMPDPSSEAARADWQVILERALPYTDLFMPSLDELSVMLPRLWHGGPIEGGAAAERADGSPVPGRPGAPASPTEAPAEPASVPAERVEAVSRLATALLAMGARIVLLKLGPEGVYLRSAGRGTLESMGPGRPADLDDWADRELWMPSLRVDVVGTVGAGDATCAGFLAAMLRGLDVVDALSTATAVGATSVEAVDAVSGVPDWETCRRRLATGWERRPLALRAAGWRRGAGSPLWIGPGDRPPRSAGRGRPTRPR